MEKTCSFKEFLEKYKLEKEIFFTLNPKSKLQCAMENITLGKKQKGEFFLYFDEPDNKGWTYFSLEGIEEVVEINNYDIEKIFIPKKDEVYYYWSYDNGVPSVKNQYNQNDFLDMIILSKCRVHETEEKCEKDYVSLAHSITTYRQQMFKLNKDEELKNVSFRVTILDEYKRLVDSSVYNCKPFKTPIDFIDFVMNKIKKNKGFVVTTANFTDELFYEQVIDIKEYKERF